MNMIIGTPARFAIELELDEKHGGAWLFGKFCYWIGGTRVGNYGLGTSLRDVMFRLEPILRDTGKRGHPELIGLPAEELFHRVTSALLGTQPSQEQQRAIDEGWARFCINPSVDVFDAWQVLLFETPTHARLICGTLDPMVHIREVKIKPGEFDSYAREAYSSLTLLHENAR